MTYADIPRATLRAMAASSMTVSTKYVRWLGLASLIAGFILTFTGPHYLMVAALVFGLACVFYYLGRKHA